jgi:hypothetical protein
MSPAAPAVTYRGYSAMRQFCIVKTSQHSPSGAQRASTEALVDRYIDALFARMPMLCGFFLNDDLQIMEISVHAWPGSEVRDELVRELIEALSELAEESPETVARVRGRAFARAIQ